MRFKWTAEEIEKLRDIYPIGDWVDLHNAFPNRTAKAIAAKARMEDIPRDFSAGKAPARGMKVLANKRVGLGITKEAFAKIYGYSVNTVLAFERGDRRPNKFQYQCYQDTLERFEA